jgi:hypothetical protein
MLEFVENGILYTADSGWARADDLSKKKFAVGRPIGCSKKISRRRKRLSPYTRRS